jgi:uncharacterized protein DUF3616
VDPDGALAYRQLLPTELIHQTLLSFRVPEGHEGEVPENRRFRSSLSSLVFADGGRTAFLGGDETIEATPTIERLVRNEDGGYGAHESFSVSDFFPLPEDKAKKGRVEEIDIEGLAVAGGYLWLSGSHSSVRKKPKGRSVEEDIARLARLEIGRNRLVIGCVPLEARSSGSFPVQVDGERCAASFRKDLRELLREDPHLGPFLAPVGGGRNAAVLPGKDNGFDLEGLAVQSQSDGRFVLLLGLRGPVLRGWAMVLELSISIEKDRLKVNELPSGLRYRKHFLDLNGLGVRDLTGDGDDLLILAGPTMVLDGPVSVFRWRPRASESAPSGDTLTALGTDALQHVLDVPYGAGCDHGEGLTKLPDGAEVMVVYDKPSPARLVGDHAVRADVFRL